MSSSQSPFAPPARSIEDKRESKDTDREPPPSEPMTISRPAITTITAMRLRGGCVRYSRGDPIPTAYTYSSVY